MYTILKRKVIPVIIESLGLILPAGCVGIHNLITNA